MNATTRNKLVNALMTRFINLYEDKYHVKPRFNRNTEKWGFGYMLDDLEAQAQDTLDYYFTLKREHSSNDFLRNYQDFNAWMAEDAEDEAMRQRLRQATKKKVEEHEKIWQQPSK